MNFYVEAMIVFGLALIASLAWVIYIHQSERGAALNAAVADTVIMAIGLINAMLYMQDARFVVPILAAAFIGTYGAVKYQTYASQTQTDS